MKKAEAMQQSKAYYFSIDGHSKVALHSDEIKYIANNIWVVLPDLSHFYLAVFSDSLSLLECPSKASS